MKLEKATITVLTGANAGQTIRALFNPFEYGIERANTFKSTAIPGLSGPLLHFINGEADTLSIELLIDDYTDPPPPGEKSVEERLAEMAGLLEIDRKLHAPPIVQFLWADLRGLR